MGAVKDALMDVEDFVAGFVDEKGNLTKSRAFIVKSAIENFGITFGEYADDVLNGEGIFNETYFDGGVEYRVPNPIFNLSPDVINDDIPF